MTSDHQPNHDQFYRRADQLMKRALRIGGETSRLAKISTYAAEQAFVHQNPEFIKGLSRMQRVPVPIEEFLEGKDFLAGVEFDIWPALKQDVIDMNPDVFIGEDPVHECMLGGATGTGKSHTSMATLAYQVYLLTCFKNPQRLFGLTPQTPIVFMLQSVSQSVTKRVIYTPFKSLITEMAYFKRFAPYNAYVDSELQLPDYNIKIIPALASLQTILGQAICGGLLDEVNFMSVVESSKKIPGPNGMGGKFDQAEVIYTNISRRRKRSFTTKGYSIGTLCTVSSTRYKDDFLDRRIDQVVKFSEPNVRVFRHAQFDVNPQYGTGHTFGYFQIVVGTDAYPTKVLEDGMARGIDYADSAKIMDIPLPYLADFQKDPDAALRDIVGIATAAISPFIRKRQKINDALFRGKSRGLKPLVEKDEVILAKDGMPTFLSENFPIKATDKAKSRWVHVDLSRVDDRCGIGMIRLDGFVNKTVGDTGLIETMPRFTVEMAVGIKPSQTAEIDIAEVRGWVMKLVYEYGLNIEGISFDGFDSQETIQALRRANIHSERVSVDIGTVGYDNLRDGLYEDRIDIQGDCNLLADELRTVEYYSEKNKIDHPPRGTKDVADGVAGALQFAMASRRVRTGSAYYEASGTMTDEHGNEIPVTQSKRVKVRRQTMRHARGPIDRR